MRKWMVLLAAALLIGSVKVVYTAEVTPPPSTDGVISLLDMTKSMQVCTAVVVHEYDKEFAGEFLALTAKHCVTAGMPATSKLTAGDPRTLKWIGEIKVVHRYSDRDLALIAFSNERDLVNTWGAAEVSPRPPKAGETIWGAGIVYWSREDPQVIFTSPGVWTGLRLREKGEKTYLAVLPVTSGQSGGPAYVDGKVFGLLTSGYIAGAPSGKILSPWTGITVLGEMP